MNNKRIKELESGLRYAYRIKSKCNVEGEISRIEKELGELKSTSHNTGGKNNG